MMRPVLIADLEYTTRALLAVAPPARAAVLAHMLDSAQARAATLMAVATHLPLAPRPPALTREYLLCLAFVAQSLAARSS